MSRVLAVAVFATTLVSANAGMVDFNSGNGGFVSSTVTDVSGTGVPWTYSASSALCNGGSGGCWTIPDHTALSDQLLTSPMFAATGATSLSFDHTFNLEDTFDGGVVEISINGGSFADVTTLYGAFSGQNYTSVIDSGFSSPIAGRSAFTGENPGLFGTYVASSILLGLSNGDTFQLQWRMASDENLAAFSPNGWRLDNINVGANAADVTAPEPGTSGMALLGLAGLAYWFRFKRRVSA